MQITYNQFKDSARKCLLEIGISEEAVNSFINEDVTLEDMELCTNISIAFDDKMSKIYPDYDGCFEHETIHEIWEYNKEFING